MVSTTTAVGFRNLGNFQSFLVWTYSYDNLHTKIELVMRLWLKLLWYMHIGLSFPSGRVAVRLLSFSDNAATATEAVGAKLYTSKWPLGAFAQKLSVISALSRIELDISHVAGEKNDDADFLSRWNQVDSLPDRWKEDSRVDCSLQFIWFFRKKVHIWPRHFSLPCTALMLLEAPRGQTQTRLVGGCGNKKGSTRGHPRF